MTAEFRIQNPESRSQKKKADERYGLAIIAQNNGGTTKLSYYLQL
jgi:hypothetical protein